MWVYLGAGFWASLLGITALAAGGSSLPLPIQMAFVAVLLGPWLPGVRQQYMSWKFVAAATLPVIALTWTGGSPLFYALLALAGSRVAIASHAAIGVGYGAAAVGVVMGRHFLAGHEFDWFVWKTYIELGVALGWAMRAQLRLVWRTRLARDEHAQLAALEERRRIARDVHDVLAHTLTILMVHLNSARLSVRDDPEGTAELLDEVAVYGRNCLEEIRSTVGLLSSPVERDRTSSPIEAARSIEDLVASHRKAGAEIDLGLDIRMEHLALLAEAPGAMWHAGYRIVQESLANAVRHAPGAPIEVRVGIDDRGLHIECSNQVREGVVRLELPSGGNGIRGMVERAAAIGGTFEAGMGDSAWVVRAELPLRTPATEREPETLGWAS
jgi:signal transduction histidine kinase